MKRKEIGQCKDCKYWLMHTNFMYHGRCLCNFRNFNIIINKYHNYEILSEQYQYLHHETFGCWYWKEKKK